MATIEKKWYNVALSPEGARLFKHYLRENDIYFEPSQYYELIHLECFMTKEEMLKANNWLLKGEIT